MIEKLNLLFVGVGGQGVLTASDIAAQVGLDLGLDAKKSDGPLMSARPLVKKARWMS